MTHIGHSFSCKRCKQTLQKGGDGAVVSGRGDGRNLKSFEYLQLSLLVKSIGSTIFQSLCSLHLSLFYVVLHLKSNEWAEVFLCV